MTAIVSKFSILIQISIPHFSFQVFLNFFSQKSSIRFTSGKTEPDAFMTDLNEWKKKNLVSNLEKNVATPSCISSLPWAGKRFIWAFTFSWTLMNKSRNGPGFLSLVFRARACEIWALVKAPSLSKWAPTLTLWQLRILANEIFDYLIRAQFILAQQPHSNWVSPVVASCIN